MPLDVHATVQNSDDENTGTVVSEEHDMRFVLESTKVGQDLICPSPESGMGRQRPKAIQ